MPIIFWVGTFPSNLKSVGDHAQTLAVEKFLSEKFSDYKVKKFTRNEVSLFLKEDVQKGDLIFIHSSGDFGDLLTNWHPIRKQIIASYPNNLIVQLPVSVHYNSPASFEEDKSFFAHRPNLLILCRTRKSAKLLKSNFGCRVKFFPDFSFYLKPELKHYRRQKILFVLRDDDESLAPRSLLAIVKRLRKPLRAVQKVTQKDVLFIASKTARRLDYVRLANQVKQKFPNSIFKDTQVTDVSITDEKREEIIMGVFDYYQHFKLVVTDRFHACVFSYMTQTPFIPLKGKISQKTTIEEVDYSRYFEGFRELVFSRNICSHVGTEPVHAVEPLNEPACVGSNVLKLIKQRRSYRCWTTQPVKKEDMLKIVEAGTYAPSAANTQAVRFKIFTAAMSKMLCQYTSPWFRKNTAPAVILVLYNRSLAQSRGLKEKWHERFIWQDTACAMQNMMLAAEALRLQTCWGSINPEQQNEIRQLIDLPSNYVICSMLLLGYSNQKPRLEKSIHQGRPIKRENPLDDDYKHVNEVTVSMKRDC